MTSFNPALSSLEGIQRQLSSAIIHRHSLRIHEGKLILLNRQGYEVDASGKEIGGTQWRRSSLVDLFAFIQREINAPLQNDEAISIRLVELINVVNREASILYDRHKCKANTIFSIKNICNAILGFLSDYRNTVFASHVHLEQDVALISEKISCTLSREELPFNIRFEHLVVLLQKNEELFDSEIFGDICQSLLVEWQASEDKRKRYLVDWPKHIAQELNNNPDPFTKQKLEILSRLLSFLKNGVIDESTITALRDYTKRFREDIEKLILEGILHYIYVPKEKIEKTDKEKESDEPPSEKGKIDDLPDGLERLVYESCLRVGPQATAIELERQYRTSEVPPENDQKWPRAYRHVLESCLGFSHTDKTHGHIDQSVHLAFVDRMKQKNEFQEECDLLLRFLIVYESRLDPEKKQALDVTHKILESFIAGKKVTAEILTSFLSSLGGFPELKNEAAHLFETLFLQVEDPEEVKSLDLSGFGLESIPVSLSRFTHLKKLNLAQNALQSLDSHDTNLLNQLEDLNLSNNQLEKLPEDFGTHLTHLNLKGNLFEKFPSSLLALEKLVHLNLNFNQLEELPQNWGNLTDHLEELKISHNYIRNISSLGQLAKLTHLHSNDNRISEFPEDLLNLSLHTVSLRENQIKSLPEMFGDYSLVSTLRHFDCRYNELVEIPNSWGMLSAISELHLSHNLLQRLPERFETQELLVVDLGSNLLSEISPYYICTPLTVHLEGNPLQSIPDLSQQKSKRTVYLNLSGCRLQHIPSLSDLPLTSLFLGFNPLQTLPSAPIPDTLRYLNLSGLTLTEAELLKLEKGLNASDHAIKGQITAEEQKKLEEFKLQRFLNADQLREQKNLQDKIPKPLLFVDKDLLIPKSIQIFSEHTQRIFGLKDHFVPHYRGQEIILHQCEAKGKGAYQQDGQVFATIPCPKLKKEQASVVIKTALQSTTTYLDDKLKNPNMRYHSEPITGEVVTSVGVLFQNKYYLPNVGDTQAHSIEQSYIDIGLTAGTLKELEEALKDKEKMISSQELREEEMEEQGIERDDRSHLDTKWNDLIEIDATQFPILWFASNSISDRLNPKTVRYLISRAIWEGGSSPKERNANLRRSIAKVNRQIRDLTLSYGPSNNMASMMMYFHANSRRDDNQMHLAVLYEGKDNRGSEAFIRYLVDKTPGVFKDYLDELIAIKENSISSIDKKIAAIAILAIGIASIGICFGLPVLFKATLLAVGIGAAVIIFRSLFTAIFDRVVFDRAPPVTSSQRQ